MTAFGATVEMASQICGSAAPNREQDFQLRPCQRQAVTVDEIIACCPHDVGQLNSWPIHLGISLRDLRMTPASAMSSASSGLAAECR
jgi:hypothetical protein